MAEPVEAKARGWFHRLAPILFAGAILGFLLYRYPAAEIASHVASGTWAPMIPIIAIAALVSLLCIGTADALLLRSIDDPPYGQVLRAKAACATLATVGYAFAHTAYAIWIGRATRTELRASIGAVLYISHNDLMSLCVASIPALLFLAGGYLPENARSSGILAAATILVAGTAVVTAGRILAGRWAERRAFFRAWATIPAKIYALSVLIRAVNIVVASLLTYLACHYFGLEIPLAAILSALPLIFLVGSLPFLNMFGFGAAQAAWVALFSPWADGAQILAFQFLFHLFGLIAIVLRGLPFLRRTLNEIAQGNRRARPEPTPIPESG